jgi:GH24 family phage-related lysozyme (muramidase)
MKYRELDQDAYRDACFDIISSMERYRSKVYDLDDGKATIGYGYTFNRNDNLATWQRAGIALTPGEVAALKRIDDARAGEKTSLGMEFSKEISAREAKELLVKGTLSDYEGPARSLGMPLSIERATFVALTYNRGVGAVQKNMTGFTEAIRSDDRVGAWYELRYNSWGRNAAFEPGLRKSRVMEAHVFGMYDDAMNVTSSEAARVYELVRDNRDHIDAVEHRFGIDLDGQSDPKSRNVIERANRDYPALVNLHGPVPTIAEAVEPAKKKFLVDLSQQSPSMADVLTDEAFLKGLIQVAPTRDGDLPYLTVEDPRHVASHGHPSLDVSMMSREDMNSVQSHQSWRNAVSVDGPSITPSDPEHPDYLLANAVRGNIERLHSSEGIALSDSQVDRLTAGLLVEVKQSGMTRVDEVMFGRMPDGEIHPSIHAYQVHDGQMDHPYTARVSVFGPDAVNVPVDQSYQRLQEVTQHIDHQRQQDQVLQQNEAQQQAQGLGLSRSL